MQNISKQKIKKRDSSPDMWGRSPTYNDHAHIFYNTLSTYSLSNIHCTLNVTACSLNTLVVHAYPFLLMYDGFTVAEYCLLIFNNVVQSDTSQTKNPFKVPLNITCSYNFMFPLVQNTHFPHRGWILLFAFHSCNYFLIYACWSQLTSFHLQGMSTVSAVQILALFALHSAPI